jgi:hypothetical protein
MNVEVPFLIREDATDEEWAKAERSFVASLGSRGFGRFDMNTSKAFEREMSRVMAVLRARATLRLACDKTAPDVMLGFALYEGDMLYWVHVYGGRAEVTMRKEGVAYVLLEDLPIRRYAFVTRQGYGRLKPNVRGWEFAPTFAIV